MKQLKDYLHLYLGCSGKLERPFVKGEVSIIAVDEYGVEIPNIDDEILFKYFKPILRPLSDMTEEEMKEWDAIPVQSQLVEVGDLRAWINGETFTFLLSKHFDLFGLIDAGLAIDSTILKQQPKQC